jgi:hypothetical protein
LIELDYNWDVISNTAKHFKDQYGQPLTKTGLDDLRRYFDDYQARKKKAGRRKSKKSKKRSKRTRRR